MRLVTATPLATVDEGAAVTGADTRDGAGAEATAGLVGTAETADATTGRALVTLSAGSTFFFSTGTVACPALTTGCTGAVIFPPGLLAIAPVKFASD